MSFYCLMCKSFVRLAAELSFIVCMWVCVCVCLCVCIGALTFTTLSSCCCIFYNMFHRTHTHTHTSIFAPTKSSFARLILNCLKLIDIIIGWIKGREGYGQKIRNFTWKLSNVRKTMKKPRLQASQKSNCLCLRPIRHEDFALATPPATWKLAKL